MQLMTNSLARLRHDESGQGLVEYVLIIAVVALAAISGMTSLATKVNTAFSTVGSILSKYAT
jgi:pilus assembly protein Flp/PilA